MKCTNPVQEKYIMFGNSENHSLSKYLIAEDF